MWVVVDDAALGLVFLRVPHLYLYEKAPCSHFIHLPPVLSLATDGLVMLNT